MSKPTIICVDDEKIILDSLKGQLISEFGDDYNIETAESGEEALNLCQDLLQKNEEIPLIIADYIMPGMKGDELLKRIREMEPKIVTVLLTGQASIEGVTRAVNLGGVFRYIAKPWEYDHLCSIVGETLELYYGERLYTDKINKLKKINTELQQTLAKKAKELAQRQGFSKPETAVALAGYTHETGSSRLSELLITIKSGVDMIHQQTAKSRELGLDNPPAYYNRINEFCQITSTLLGNLTETLHHNITDNGSSSFDNRISKIVNEQISAVNRQFADNFMELTNRITTMERQFSGNSERLAAWDNEEIVILDANDVLFITSEESQTYVVTPKVRYKMRETLDILETRLCNKNFFRCHRSFIINMKHITKISPWFGNNSYISKFEGLSYEIPISRNRIKEMKKLLEIS